MNSRLLVLFLSYYLFVLPYSIAGEQADNEGGEVEGSFADVSILDKLFNSASEEDESSENKQLEIRVQEGDKQGEFQNVARVRVIDKTLGKLYILNIPLETKKSVKELSVRVLKCWSPAEKTLVPEDRALIEISEIVDKKLNRLFYGWMFSQSPSVSQLTHSRFDVTLDECITEDKS